MSVSLNTSLKSLLAELVQMPTLNTEPATATAGLDWVKYQLRDLPLIVTESRYGGHDMAVFSTRRTKRPKVLLHAHLDISSAPPELFTLKEQQGRYLGRGVFDMKFAIACYIKLLWELGDRLPEYDFAVSITTDEEGTGGMHGAQGLMSNGWRPGVIINPDSTGDGRHWCIQRAAKGFVAAIATATGEAGHGSRPWLAPSANLRLLNYLAELTTHFPAEPCTDPDHQHATLNVGVIEGGQLINQISARARAELDIRFMPDQSPAELEAVLQTLKSRHEGIEVEVSHSTPAVGIESDNPYFAKLQAIMEQVTSTTPELIVSHGASESGHFVRHNIPVLMFGPPGGGHHGDHEWIDAAGVEQSARIISAFVEEVAAVGASRARTAKN